MRINQSGPAIAASVKPATTGKSAGARVDAGHRSFHSGPDLVDIGLLLAIGMGAGAVEANLGFSGVPLAMLGGAAVFGGANRIRTSLGTDSDLGAFTGCLVGTAAFSAAHVASHFGFHPGIAAGITSGAMVSAIAMAY